MGFVDLRKRRADRKVRHGTAGAWTVGLATAAFCLSCAAPPEPPPAIPEKLAFRVEERPLPVDPADEKLPPETPAGESVEPLLKGSCAASCPAKSGLLVSEARAIRDGYFRIRYKELRALVESDRSVWGVQREYYESRLKLADQALRAAQPSWLDRHALAIGVIGGFVLGSIATVAIAETNP